MIDLYKLITKNKLERLHDVVICILVDFIYNNVSEFVNYDHVDYLVPKSKDIPLRWRGKNYDIAFLFGDRIVFLEVKTVSLTDVLNSISKQRN